MVQKKKSQSVSSHQNTDLKIFAFGGKKNEEMHLQPSQGKDEVGLEEPRLCFRKAEGKPGTCIHWILLQFIFPSNV